MRGLEERWLDREARNAIPYQSKTESSQFPNEKTSSVDTDLERQMSTIQDDRLLEIAKLIVALKYRKVRIGRTVILVVAFVIFTGYSWLVVSSPGLFPFAGYALILQLVTSLLYFVTLSQNRQHYITTVVVRNLRNGINLNKHDICKIGLVPQLLFLSACALTYFSVAFVFFCPTAFSGPCEALILPFTTVLLIFITNLCCSRTLFGPRIDCAVDTEDIETLLQEVIQGKS